MSAESIVLQDSKALLLKSAKHFDKTCVAGGFHAQVRYQAIKR
jgi:hypothetical protein